MTMTPGRWARIKQVFQSALERGEEERAAFLDEACGGDEDLRQHVELLIVEHREATRIQSPVKGQDLSGKRVSHYNVVEKLGEGGMGVVYRAEDSKLRRSVALKFLRPDAVENVELKARFLQEAEAAAAIDHPNICTVYEIDEADGQTFLAMSHVEGETLAERARRRPLPLDEALDIAVQAAEGLAAAHRKGIVHRDIKSANIMVDGEGRVKIMDFGLAHLAGSTRITQTGAIVGTPAYMSPGQVRGEKLDRRTDIWSLGVVIYELLTGRLPFAGESAQSVALAIQNEAPEPVTAVRAGVPLELERIIGKALAKKAGERYQHVEDLLVDLRAVGQPGEQKPGHRVLGGWRKVLPAVAAVILVVAVAAVAVSWLRESVAGPPSAPVPFTTHYGSEHSPAFSPDGEQIAFVAEIEEEGNVDVYVRQVDGAGQMRLTDNPAPDMMPTWSPDGKTIVFLRRLACTDADWEQGRPNYDHYQIPAIGGPERRFASTQNLWLESLTYRFGGRNWSPDGRFLLLRTGNPSGDSYDIFQYSMETGERRPFWQQPLDKPATNLSYSPDGRHVACAIYRGLASDIYVFHLDEDGLPRGDPKRLTSDETWISGLDWTADSRSIIYASTRTGGERLWRLPLDGGEPTALPFGGNLAITPAVSRQGNRFAYVKEQKRSDIWRVEIPRGEEGKPAAPQRLIASTWEDHTPRFSPDGKQIVFSSSRSGSFEIWVCNSDGLHPRQLSDMDNFLTGDGRWSPDGQWIAYDSSKTGRHDIYVISSGGGEPRKLTPSPTYEAIPSWSRDGKWIYYSARTEGGSQIARVPAEGGEEIGLSPTSAREKEALESPDGQHIYYAAKHRDGIWRIPVEGGEPTPVLEHGRAWQWTMVEDGIYVLVPGPAIEFFDFATERRERVMDLDVEPWQIAVSPDGRWLLYVTREPATSDIMLVENFR